MQWINNSSSRLKLAVSAIVIIFTAL